MAQFEHCPCGSQQTYQQCCAKYHQGDLAPTPESLMRSRYAAYALGDMGYIKRTMRGQPLTDFDEDKIGVWAKSVAWLGLEVLGFEHVSAKLGYVTFKAHYRAQGAQQTIHERSEFRYDGNQWFYVAGVPDPLPRKKPGRNEPCFCGSQKKFKHCHGINR